MQNSELKLEENRVYTSEEVKYLMKESNKHLLREIVESSDLDSQERFTACEKTGVPIKTYCLVMVLFMVAIIRYWI